MKQEIELSDHFTYRKIAKFTIPSIAMMIFMSIYGVVDGFFVSNYVGGTQFAALNLIMPYIMVFGAAGVTNMFLDWLLVGVLRLGLAGAATATDLGMAVG